MRTAANNGSDQDLDGSDTDLLLAQSEGSGIRTLLDSNDSYRYPFATWMPDGRVLVSRVEVNVRQPKSSFVALVPSTDEQQVFYTLNPIKDLIGDYPARELSDPAVSPDGSKVLFGLDGSDYAGKSGGLQVLDLFTGKKQTIDPEGANGTGHQTGPMSPVPITRNRSVRTRFVRSMASTATQHRISW